MSHFNILTGQRAVYVPTGHKTRQAWWAFAGCLPVTQPYSDTRTQQYHFSFQLISLLWLFGWNLKLKWCVCVSLGLQLRMESYDKFLSLSWGTLAGSQICPLLNTSHNCSFIVPQPFSAYMYRFSPVLPHTAQRYNNRNHTGELRSCFWDSSTPPTLPFTCADYFHAVSPICPPWRPLYMSARSSVGSHSFSHRSVAPCVTSPLCSHSPYILSPPPARGVHCRSKRGFTMHLSRRGDCLFWPNSLAGVNIKLC